MWKFGEAMQICNTIRSVNFFITLYPPFGINFEFGVSYLRRPKYNVCSSEFIPFLTFWFSSRSFHPTCQQVYTNEYRFVVLSMLPLLRTLVSSLKRLVLSLMRMKCREHEIFCRYGTDWCSRSLSSWIQFGEAEPQTTLWRRAEKKQLGVFIRREERLGFSTMSILWVYLNLLELMNLENTILIFGMCLEERSVVVQL